MNEVTVIYISFDLPSSYQTAKDGSSQSKYNNHGAGQAKNHWNAVGKRQNKNRVANRRKYIKNLLKKTF